jgi:hypothetical protein
MRLGLKLIPVFALISVVAFHFPKILPADVFFPDLYTRFVGFEPTTELEWFLAFGLAHQAELVFSLLSGLVHLSLVFLPILLETFEACYLLSLGHAPRPRVLLGFASLMLACKVGYEIGLAKQRLRKVLRRNYPLVILSVLLMMLNDLLQAFGVLV